MPLTKIEGPSVGNVTANNVTVSSNTVNAATFYAGANVYMNTSAVFVGNSTVNVTITSSSVASSNTVVANGYSVTLVAGESLSARDAVYIEPALTGGTAGRAYKMDADVLVKSSQAFFAGFALAAASAAANVAVQISGVVSGFSGLTTGAVYYAGSTAGAITATKPLHPLPVGMAISTTQLLINTGIKREQEQSENVSAVYGYVMGGTTNAVVVTTDRITFSTGATAASTVSNLSAAKYTTYAISDTTVYGYAAGGYSDAYSATTDRITFATSVTVAYATANLPAAVAFGHSNGLSDGAIYGYRLGGYSTTYNSTADRLTFTTGIFAASTVSNLSTARYGTSTVSDAGTYGYNLGGDTGADVTTADRVTFSTSATAAYTAANLSQARRYPAGVSDGGITYGYLLGGRRTVSSSEVATADRLTFSTGATAASTASNLTTARGIMTGVSDGMVYGYVAGGSTNYATNGSTTSAERITFSTSATAAYTTANLSQARYGLSGLSDGAV